MIERNNDPGDDSEDETNRFLEDIQCVMSVFLIHSHLLILIISTWMKTVITFKVVLICLSTQIRFGVIINVSFRRWIYPKGIANLYNLNDFERFLKDFLSQYKVFGVFCIHSDLIIIINLDYS